MKTSMCIKLKWHSWEQTHAYGGKEDIFSILIDVMYTCPANAISGKD